MRVALALDGLSAEPAGVGRYIRELARFLPGEVAELLFTLDGRLCEARSVAGLLHPPLSAQKCRTEGPLRQVLLRSPGFARWAQEVLDLAGRIVPRDFGVEVVHGPKYYLPPLRGARGVVTFHDLSTIGYPKWHLPGRAARVTRAMEQSVKRAAKVITDSEAVRREVIGHFGLGDAQVVAVPLGVNQRFGPLPPQEVAPSLRRYALSPGGYALSVATLEPRKNLATLLRAYRAIPAQLRRRVPLVLVGGMGWGSDGLRQQIDAGVREGWLRWLGYVGEGELPPLYAGARGFLYPSYYEGFGLPVLEAMASGVPVVASDLAVLSEITEGCAQLVQPDDTSAMVAAIRRCLEDDVWARAAAEAGRQRAARYTWHECARRTAAVYRQASQT